MAGGWLEAFGLGAVTAVYALNQEEHDAKKKPCQERNMFLDLDD